MKTERFVERREGGTRPGDARSGRCRRGERMTGGFTLLELLAVIAIIGVLAAIALPNMGKFKPSVMAAATRQMLDDISRARQLAMSQRTTVYMVFVPPNFWTDPIYRALPASEQAKAQKLVDKQMVGYNFVTLRSLGDQPGRATPRYLGPWRTLPEGAFILPHKFGPRYAFLNLYTNGSAAVPALQIPGFNWTVSVPFPSEQAPRRPGKQPYVALPYIAFNEMGQLVDSQNQLVRTNEFMPLALGNVIYPRDQNTKVATMDAAPTVVENPRGNSTNAFNVVNVDWLTGRARVERPEIR